jgi:hypothetical protein
MPPSNNSFNRMQRSADTMAVMFQQRGCAPADAERYASSLLGECRMRKTLVLATLLTLTCDASAQMKGVGTFRFPTQSGAQKATVILKTKAFDGSKRKVRVVKEGESYVTKVDGRTG